MTDKAYNEYIRWKSSSFIDEKMREELESIAGDPAEIENRFGSSLSFGTAGLRGIMACGSNNMNVFTVGQATQGFCDYIKSVGGGEVAIAYDTRNNSELFAKTCACVLAGNGIRSYLFDGPRPTPELSFALRHYGCTGGINVTASHNPKEYNGYKAYWADGAQLSPEQAGEVSAHISRCDIFEGTVKADFDEGIKSGLIRMIGKETDEIYLSKVLEQAVDPAVLAEMSDMSVVYTPLHGAGKALVPEVLKRAGLKNVITVPEQMIQDGNFPTVRFPNPEYPEAFTIGRKLAEENNCDLIIATDPDADRMGLMIRDGDGFIVLTGNQIGCLLLDYIISAMKETGRLPEDAYAVKSIVSTELASEICRANGVVMHDVLTGFKFIGETIKKHEQLGYGTFLLGFEESYGYLKGTYARDKDAVVASMLAAEMAAYYRSRGMTLKDALDGLYKKYGFFAEKTVGKSYSKEKMTEIMTGFHSATPEVICGEEVISVRDYLAGTITDMKSGKTEPTGLPSSDVLYYKTENCVVVVRPSGTEPKIKFYYMAKGGSCDDAALKIARCEEDIAEIIGK